MHILVGKELRDVNIRWLRCQIGIVSQKPVVLNTSIAHNICYGVTAADISDEDVVNATKWMFLYSLYHK